MHYYSAAHKVIAVDKRLLPRLRNALTNEGHIPRILSTSTPHFNYISSAARLHATDHPWTNFNQIKTSIIDAQDRQHILF